MTSKMFPARNVNITESVVANLCLEKPHVCLLYPELRKPPYHFSKIFPKIRAQWCSLCLSNKFKKKRVNEHEVILWQLLKGTTKDKTHKKATKKRHSVLSIGYECSFPVFSLLFCLLFFFLCGFGTILVLVSCFLFPLLYFTSLCLWI